MSAAYASSVFCTRKLSHLVISEREGGLIGLASVKKYEIHKLERSVNSINLIITACYKD